jgi:hypothetical protein
MVMIAGEQEVELASKSKCLDGRNNRELGDVVEEEKLDAPGTNNLFVISLVYV